MDAIYARQSVEKKDSISIESQIENCRTKVLRGEEYTTYIDRGYSGKNTQRPKFIQMMTDIKAGKIKKVIIYRLDRISRNLLDFANMIEVFDKYGVSIVSFSDQIDTTSPMGRAMLNIAMVFAQLERETIQDRVRDNYYARGKDGFYLGGAAPYGYQKVQTTHNGKKTYTFIPDEGAADLVEKLFTEYAKTDVALGVLCGRLNKEGKLTNKSKPWTSVSLGRLLRNPVYVKADADVFLYLKNKGAVMNNTVDDYIGQNGCYLYGERKNTTTSKFTDISNCFVTIGLHEGLIDSDVWLACQNKMDTNKQVKNSGKGTHTWLSGIIKCGYCKMAINVVNGYKDKKYITCGGRKLRICYDRSRTYLIEDLENAVSGKLIKAIKKRLSEYDSTQKPKENKEVNALKIQLVKIEDEIDALMEKVSTANETLFRYINQKIEELDTRKREVLEKIGKLLSGKTQKSIPLSYLLDAASDWDAIPFEKKKEVAKLFISAVYVTDDGVDVQCKNVSLAEISEAES